jgi:thioredoxin reductase
MFVVILGAGPAGMTCANALHTFGIQSMVVERSAHLGGAQRTNFHPNIWLLGAPEESGRAMTERVVRHFLTLPIATRRETSLRAARRVESGFALELASPQGIETVAADAIVLATGMQARATPELEALAARDARVIIGPLSDSIRDDIRDRRVLVLGGGDNALDHALYLAGRGNRVSVRTRARLSARPHFRADCAAHPAIDVREHAPTRAVVAREDGIQVDTDGHPERYDWLLVMYGYRPNIEYLDAFEPGLRPRQTDTGHVIVDAWQRTSVPSIHAAGDLADPLQPSVLSAMAQGLAAAKAISLSAAT